MGSGVFILARSHQGSWRVGQAMSAEGSGKRYLARVCGHFPGSVSEPVVVDCPLRMPRMRWTDGGMVDFASTEPPAVTGGIDETQPAQEQAQAQAQAQETEDGGGGGRHGQQKRAAADDDRHGAMKAAKTAFRFLGYDKASDTSLVQAELHSGRRHQIRAHLAVLRHPIANDHLYCSGGAGAAACALEGEAFARAGK